MAEWLSKNFGEKPIKQEIIDERDISWPLEEQPIRIFLIKYKLKNGLEGIGFTGPITWSFVGFKETIGLTPEEWVYCYVGWFIQFFFIHSQPVTNFENKQKAEQFILELIARKIIEANFYKICHIFQLEEDLIYYAIEVIKKGEQFYLVGTKDNYIFYHKDFPPMQLPPLFYFLGKTFNPFMKL
ncbi:MAG TPA: hypothetical protein V6D26_05100 [Stenomitos sp.]